MNKNFYRIVFNKARGMLMVVGEFATSAHGTSSPSSGSAQRSPGLVSKLSAVQFALLVSLGFVSLASTAAVVADSQAPGHQQPTIISSANGTPQINIQPPSSGGVSRNVYSQFDVDNKGVVLNNSYTSTQTQLAGMVNGNGNLTRGEAKVILNEINARNASQLHGMIEIAGQKAQVVIANPSGITCNGCGFINAHRATLTTGQVQMNNGLITGYDVNNGEIVIQGAGLDSSRQNSTDLIARAVKVNAGIWANELKMTAGRNNVDADHNNVTAKAADGSTSPALAIDVASLGGMYANKIRLLGTENGVGVHNAGNIGTSAGDVVVNADGSIGNTGSINASQNLRLTSQHRVDNSGQIFAAGNTDISAGGMLNNNGIIAANNNTTLSAASVASSSTAALAAGINSDGTLGSTGNLTVNSQGELKINSQASAAGLLTATGTTLDLSGSQAFGNDIWLQASSGKISTAKATVAATHQLTATARDAIHNDGGKISADTLNLTARSFSNQQGLVQQLGTSNLRLSFDEGVNNAGGKIASNGLNLTLNTSSFNNQQGVMTAAGNLTLLTGALLNSSGQLISSGALQLNTQGQQLDNTNGTIIASGDAQLNTGTLSNIGGQMQLAGNALLNTGGTGLDNTSGLIRGGTSLSLTTAQLINRNTQSENTGIEGQAVTLTSDTLDNSDGAIRANDLLDITAASTLNNSRGLISSASLLNFNDGNSLAFTNTAGTLIGGSAVNLTAYSLSGDGRVLSQNTLKLVLQQAFFNQGDVIANGDMIFTVGNNLVNQSRIQAGGVLNLRAGGLENQQSAEISAGENHLLIYGDAINRGLLDGGLTHVSASTLTNTGTGRLYGDHVALQTGTLNNLAENGTAATIAARDRLDIGAGVINNYQHGLVYSAGDIAIGGILDGSWRASGKSSVLKNHSATLESAGDMTLNIGEIININDHLVTEVVVVEQSSHHEAVLSSSTTRYNWDDVDTSTSNKYGVHAAIMPDGSSGRTFYEYQYDRTLTETQAIESDPGQIMAGGNLTIHSDRVNNHDSRIVAGGLLGGIIGELNNIATTGKRVITDIGTQIRWYAKKSGGGIGGTTTSQGKDRDTYSPDDIIQTIDLQTLVWQGNGAISGSGTTLAGRDISGADTPLIHPGDITADTGQLVEIVPPGSDGDTVINRVTPNTRLPDNSLYQLHPGSDVPFLIETDPRFTNEKQWLGSDYMQNQFMQDPGNVLKRLGEGFYEQKLIRQQVVALTGNHYLSGYRSDEAQFQALMDAGVTFGKDYNLTLGVALTAQQMALLTSDMIWLVKQTITLPDGTTQDVLVPQLYACVKSGDLDGSGALLAGSNISLNVSKDLTNSGHISGRGVTQLTADSLNNSGFIGGDKVSLQARTDINNIGGTLQGGSSLTAIAGRDINSISTLGGSQGNITFDRPAGIYMQNDNGTLGLQAMNNINLTATQISNSGKDSQTKIIAGNDLNLNTITTTSSEKGSWGKGNDRTLTQRTDVGSQINGNGEVLLSAGNDLNARAATVSASDALTVVAGNDITLTSGDASYHLTENSHQTSRGMLSKKSVTTHDEVQSQRAVSSNFDGDRVTMQARHDLSVSGSNVVGTHDVALAAGNDLTITTAEESRQENHLRKETKSGLSGTGGIGVTVGSSSLKITDDAATHSSLGSTVGSSQGNLTLTAGTNLTVQGSDVLAGKDLSLTGKDVNILAAENQNSQTHTVEQKQSGLTLALSGAVGSAINSAVSAANEASNESNDRLAALKGVKAALTGVQAYQGTQLAEAGGSEGSMIGVNLSYGSQSSKSTQTATQTSNQGSTLTAGNHLTINATGTDINVQGSQLQAGNDASLSAARDVNLTSAQDSHRLTGKNESKGGSVGVGINFGQGANGLSLNASVNKGKGSETGNGTSHSETTVNAGNNLTINSGRDTTLTGAQVSGEKVTLDVGRNLTLTSEQDSDYYDSKQQNVSAGGSISMGGGSGSVNLSRDRMHSTFETVQEQTGIFAGAGGFNVTVGEHTQLNGAVIGSTATADRNKLDTGTLGFSDIKNSAEYEVEHQSVGISSGGSMGGQFAGNMTNGLLTGVNGSGSDSSTTKSAVSEGTISIRDQDKQTQDVADLSRDVENANPGLAEIFDKEKEQNRLREAQLIGEIGSQTADIARTEGQISATKTANEKMSEATQSDRDKALADLKKQDPTKQYSEDDVSKQVYNNFYNQAFIESGFGTGGKVQMAIQAATAAVQGMAGGNIGQAISGAASPYLAEQIHILTEGNPEAQAMAHAVVGAVTSYATGNSALAGAAGAVSGELMAQLVMDQLYPGKKVSELSETEKQTISALGTLAAGLAGGVVGDSTADAIAGAKAGKNAVENNLFGGNEESQVKFTQEHGKDVLSCADDPSSASCQRGEAVNKAIAGALATGGVASLTAPAQAMWALGVGANAGMQYIDNGEINPANSVIAGWENVLTIGNGLWGTVGWNAAGGALTSQINGDNPLTGAITNGVGAGVGYGVGNYIVKPIANTAGKLITDGWNPKFEPNLLKYTEIKGQLGITKEMLPSKIPGAMGNAGGSLSSEFGSSLIQHKMDEIKK